MLSATQQRNFVISAFAASLLPQGNEWKKGGGRGGASSPCQGKGSSTPKKTGRKKGGEGRQAIRLTTNRNANLRSLKRHRPLCGEKRKKNGNAELSTPEL